MFKGWFCAQADNGFFAGATAGNPAGPYTRSEGFWGYNEICEKFLEEGSAWNIIVDPDVSAPYAVNGRTWMGYDDPASIQRKARYILDMELAGAMFWSIDTEDFLGQCGAPFSLALTAATELNGGPMTPPPDWTTPDPNYSPTTPEPATPPPTESCPGIGTHPNPVNCQHYYTCMPGPEGGWIIMPGSCGEGLAFNPAIGACDWPANVPGCSSASTEHPGKAGLWLARLLPAAPLVLRSIKVKSGLVIGPKMCAAAHPPLQSTQVK
jgi:chitinase